MFKIYRQINGSLAQVKYPWMGKNPPPVSQTLSEAESTVNDLLKWYANCQYVIINRSGYIAGVYGPNDV